MCELTPNPQKRINRTFIKTPRIRKLFNNSESIERSNILKDIGLCDSMWHTYRVNALYNFSYKIEKLKQYQIILASYIQKAVLKNQFETPVKSQKFVVKVEPLPFTAFTERDNPSVKISIILEDGKYRVQCFTGFLLSVGRKEGFLEKQRIEAEAVILPLFLCEFDGDMFLDCVLSFLTDTFHCYVGPLKFSPGELRWMLTLWSCPEYKNRSSTTILQYDIPLEDIDLLEFVIDPKSMSEIWKQTVEPNAIGEISENHVEVFLSVLEKKILKMFSIDVLKLQLSIIKTPVATVHGDHSIMVCESDALFSIMRHLTHLSQEMGR